MKNWLTLVGILSALMAAQAQSSAPTDYLVLAKGDTLYGSVQHINEKGMSPRYYKKLRFTDAHGRRKKYKHAAVSAFRKNATHYESFRLRSSSQGFSLVNARYDINRRHGEWHFLRVMHKGALSHYVLEWWEQGESTLQSMDLLKKTEDSFFVRANQGVLGLKRKVLKNYFSDCPVLGAQIAQRELTEVTQIVDFYNSSCR